MFDKIKLFKQIMHENKIQFIYDEWNLIDYDSKLEMWSINENAPLPYFHFNCILLP